MFGIHQFSLGNYKTDFLKRIISVPSVGSNELPNAPYGRKSKEVLDLFIEEAKNQGFRTEIMDNRVGYIEFGDGPKMVAILCHLDVVPAGLGWDTDPFELTIKNKMLYGRGIVDDKGPACSAFFAMKELKDSGFNPRTRIRLILGTDEERTCSCVEYYAKHGETPTYGITSDASYPVIFAEKTILQIKLFEKNGTNIIMAHAGEAANMVPASCSYTFNGATGSIEGKSAHASTPHLGDNAATKLSNVLFSKGLKREDIGNNGGLLGFIADYLDKPDSNKLAGSNVEDISGLLTSNLGILRINDNEQYAIIDLRCPVTADATKILANITRIASEYGLDCEIHSTTPALYKDKTLPEVKILMDIWKKHIQEFDGYEPSFLEKYSEPCAIGGGTYARHINNILAFGPQVPWNEDQCHQANEHISIKDFVLGEKLLKEAIVELSNLASEDNN